MATIGHQRVKLLIAGAAASLLAAIGGVAVVAGGQQPAQTITGSRMNVGDTATTTTAPPAPKTSIARPAMKAERPRGF